MKSSEIRERFLDYFNRNGHAIIDSSSLVPGNDPTLLFTNAGMVQFKDVFLGQDKRNYNRATSSQRCVRAGGKHNDLENVGYTARHHTFFEMLGNFSFGDYFKQDAIKFAWEFLTIELGLPEEKLWVTVHEGDQEAEDIWLKEMGVSADRFSRMGDKDNFWSMGDTGPCGPCSEIFYDHGSDVPGGPPGSPDDDLDRYIEIWNLVFMQFDQAADGTRTPLPKPSVDTGMGLERIAAVMQNVHSNYEIDLFQALIKDAAAKTSTEDLEHKSLRVIADHIRSCAFLIADGVVPSNEGRGYVLRRIIRRAIRHGHKLGQENPFFNQLVTVLVNQMGAAYPSLAKLQALVEKVLLTEEEQFAKTLDKGMKILTDAISDLDGNTIPGEIVFKLYDTYGFPVDLTADVAREKELEIDEAGFEIAMEAQRQMARDGSNFSMQLDESIELEGATEFTGYDSLVGQGNVTNLLKGSTSVAELSTGDEGVIVLDKTAFYAESGGQVGDLGSIRWDGGEFQVLDCSKNGNNHLHIGKVTQGSIKPGDAVSLSVDGSKRDTTAKHHSATHLLHAALRMVLGDHVQQKGSLVTPDKLRFDFAHFEAVTNEQLADIENIVNQQIQANTEVTTDLMDIDSAKAKGAMALFGEKYGDEVRVLTMGQDRFSVELCGGTHVNRTGDIGVLKITAESGIAAGVRRIEAVAGPYALAYISETEKLLASVGEEVKGNRNNTLDKVKQLQVRSKQLEKDIEALKGKLASSAGSDLAGSAVDVKGVKVLAAKLDGVAAKDLRDLMDQLKNKLGSAAIVLASVNDGKIQLAAGVTKDLIPKIKAGNLVNQVATQVGGKGGGKPDMAMAGGQDISALSAALETVVPWVTEQL